MHDLGCVCNRSARHIRCAGPVPGCVEIGRDLLRGRRGVVDEVGGDVVSGRTEEIRLLFDDDVFSTADAMAVMDEQNPHEGD